MGALAEEIVHEATGTTSRSGRGSRSYAEYRSRTAGGRELRGVTDERFLFWKYLTAKNTGFGPRFEGDELSDYLFDEHEASTLSKATGPAGGFLVPSDFDNLVTSARRARNVIGEAARVIETDHGRALPLPVASAHGAAVWTAVSAEVR